MKSCAVIPQIKGKDGNVKDSKLFNDLLSFTNNNREQTNRLYYITKNPKFQSDYSDILKYDDLGEVTMNSLLKLDLSSMLEESNLKRKVSEDYGFFENDAPVVYQWDRPNAWASFNTLAVAGLDRYGYKAEARRIASKYVESVSAIFGRTQQLWEKFNAVTGDIDVKDEYAMPGDFMGWTAGAFIYCQDYLAEN